MTPDELRALADALERFSLGTGKIGKAADYLRACADEKPVGVYVHRPAELRYGVEWLVGDPMPNGTQLFTHPAPTEPQADAQPVAWVDVADSYEGPYIFHGKELLPAGRHDLYTHPAPAAPQADIGRLRECAQRLIDGARWGLAGALGPSSKAREIPSSAWSDVKSRHLASLRDALAAPQAEPKREALSDTMVIACARVAIARIQPDEWVATDADLIDFARAIESEHGIGGSDDQAEPKREPLSDAQLASVCLSYRHDFGLLNKDEQARLMLEARDWERAFRKEWQREPLSDDYILDTANEIHRAMPVCADEQEELLQIARAVERAHGIGGRDDTK